MGWSVDGFAKFWAAPDPALVPAMLTEDVAGYWPGSDEPVRGVADYTKALEDILALLPGMTLEVAEHATNGDCTFIRWIMHATGTNGPFTISGIDRVRLRDGLVCENVIRFDSAHLRSLAGLS
jgi:ketosteroid isomerase-like protein